MKRTCLFTKSAGGEVKNDNIVSTVDKLPKSTSSTSTSAGTNTIDNSNWFDRNRQKIGVGMMGLGSGMLLATYIMQKAHAKDIRRLMEKKEKQKEEDNKTE